MPDKKKPVVLIIRDGWGDNPGGEAMAVKNGDAPRLAKTPFHDQLYANYPVSHLSASGGDVGLPDGQMGNSEVGHLNIGAGRIVYQDLTRINKAIANGHLAQNAVLRDTFARAGQSRLHLIGLVSDGGVHSHQEHLVALASLAHDAGVKDIMVHAITDGRDTSPTAGAGYLSWCEDRLGAVGARISTVVGRYYAMDRDKRWDRTKIGWDAIVLGKGTPSDLLPSEAVRSAYTEQQKTDEFILPIIFDEPDQQRVRDGDVVLFFNFRADRARQLSMAFLQKDFSGFARGVQPKVHYVTLTEYDENYGVPNVFPPDLLQDVLGTVISKAGLRQVRIAETEKYPHVTYFFNGGAEEPCEGEERIMLQSPKDVATYDEKPQMSAVEVTDALLGRIEEFDVIIVNFANPDMVGHTGVLAAAISAVECIDHCVQRVVERVLGMGGALLLTADHGNCDQMICEDGSPHTAHTTNLVHFIYVAADAGRYALDDGILADIAPTMLDILGLEKPAAMTGSSRLRKLG
ncbi:MAG: 2,3-bisphosphoglycerate-independent phosphoglycerate mutase [Verrucomicrobiales bacterium]|nr:2,3-bisphosphoglycerate-independent phosphoglycerate mutase [Verrucomicrobiae bacterium]MCP5553300.1 2,3-bisphosphoglycerate-independent phosphoglycerate mutase [Akkermansiaceae bacterium]